MGRDFSMEGLLRTLGEGFGWPKSPPMVERALKLAFDGHQGQFREQRDDTARKVPYVVHPVGVALMAKAFLPLVELPDDLETLVSICLTHDLIEDTDIGPGEVERILSPRVAEIVQALTKPLIRAQSSREERNELFVRQIMAAGPTAMFVKICDHCHNISRPNQTPTSLLEKMLRKGHTSYLRFFDDGLLPTRLRDEYLRRLALVDGELDQIKRYERPIAKSFTLPDAIAHCIKASENKTLELHDVADVLQTVTGAAFVRIRTADEFTSEVGALAGGEKATTIISTLRSQIGKGRIEASKLPKEFSRAGSLACETVFVVPLDHSSDARNDRVVFVGVNTRTTADWVEGSSLRMITAYLSDRLRAQERGVVKGLAVDLVNYRLDVDIEDVVRLKWTRADLVRLRNHLDFAEFARQTLLGSLQYEFGGELVSFIESRVKLPRALLKKMSKRKLADILEVEDLLGIRVVCVSSSAAAEIAIRIKERFLLLFPFGQGRLRPDCQRAAESLAGYKAIHLLFSLSSTENSSVVGCEIQIRSAFQDAWARVSHDIAYKKEGRQHNERLLGEKLKALAQLRDEADHVIDQLFEATRRKR